MSCCGIWENWKIEHSLKLTWKSKSVSLRGRNIHMQGKHMNLGWYGKLKEPACNV
jgi:hypothetical protein